MSHPTGNGTSLMSHHFGPKSDRCYSHPSFHIFLKFLDQISLQQRKLTIHSSK